ncbi:MAG: hypothetical protein AAGC60_22360 [Acidobacteriota bacterium]
MSQSSAPFDEELLSGYLDGTLSHREMQRVRIRLEDDPSSRRLFEEMRALRQAALDTRFPPPEDSVWPELPRTPVSRFGRSLGWLLLCSWLVIVGALGLWHLLRETGDALEVFLVLGLPGAFLLLFGSVLVDRLHEARTDRYRDVHR